MKKLVLSLVAVVLVAFLAACGGGGSSTNKGGVGESCTRRDDCQDTLRCVKAVCVASEEDGDTNEVAKDGDKNEKDTDTDQVATDGDKDTVDSETGEAGENIPSFKMIGIEPSVYDCNEVTYIIAKYRPGGVAGWGGVTAICGESDSSTEYENMRPLIGDACDDFYDSRRAVKRPKWWDDYSDSDAEFVNPPTGRYRLFIRYEITGDTCRTSPLKILDGTGNECLSYDMQADAAHIVAEYDTIPYEGDGTTEYHDNVFVFRPLADFNIEAGMVGNCSQFQSLLGLGYYQPEWAVADTWGEGVRGESCIAVSRSLTESIYFNPRAHEDPQLEYQSAKPASIWCWPPNDPDCVTAEAAAQAASYPQELPVDGDYGDYGALVADCNAHRGGDQD